MCADIALRQGAVDRVGHGVQTTSASECPCSPRSWGTATPQSIT
jgi:hypothetical protein